MKAIACANLLIYKIKDNYNYHTYFYLIPPCATKRLTDKSRLTNARECI